MLQDTERELRREYQEAAEAGVTYEQMSAATGVSRSMLCMWLRGQRRVAKLATLDKLSRGRDALLALQ